jgi:hypothetical protein
MFSLLCPQYQGRPLPAASRVFFTSDEECSSRAILNAICFFEGTITSAAQELAFPEVSRPFYGSDIPKQFHPDVIRSSSFFSATNTTLACHSGRSPITPTKLSYPYNVFY